VSARNWLRKWASASNSGGFRAASAFSMHGHGSLEENASKQKA
jgi:hypothetical protein